MFWNFIIYDSARSNTVASACYFVGAMVLAIIVRDPDDMYSSEDVVIQFVRAQKHEDVVELLKQRFETDYVRWYENGMPKE